MSPRTSLRFRLKANGEDLKTIQEMLRDATFKVTADVFTQAITNTKREDNKVVQQLIAEPGRDDGENAKGPWSYWTLLDPRGFKAIGITSLESWRPRRDLNPCYRRESPRPSRGYKYLEGAGGTARTSKTQ
jgi:hypothetical protein